MELAIAIYAFLFDSIFNSVDVFFVATGSLIAEKTSLLLLLKGFLSVVLLIVPTALMGGTLPLLAAWLQKNADDAGRRSARFYSTNSLGAVFGSFLAGFFLVQWTGLHITLQMTALANAVVGGIAVLLARRKEETTPSSTAKVIDAQPGTTTPAQKDLLQGCLIVALTGGVSMGLEVLESRGLSLIFGASLQAFAIVLMAFILGIGIGSAIIASPRWKLRHTETAVAFLLLAVALCIGLLIFNIEKLVEVYRYLRVGLARNTVGYTYQLVLSTIISLFVLGIPAGLLGSVLPLWIRIISGTSLHLGNNVGRLLTWNTCGAVVGVLATGFVFMPLAGLRGALGLMAAILSLMALWLIYNSRNYRRLAAAAAILVFSILAGFTGGEGWRSVLISGVFRLRETEVNKVPISATQKAFNLVFFEDAPDATVTVEQHRRSTNLFYLKVNGKTDASSANDLSTQLLCAHLPLGIRPDSKDVFVLGFGSGVTVGAVSSHPVEHITVAENCAPILRAEKFFRPWNRNVLSDPRVRLREDDARTVLKLSQQRYDVIICEPSNPWTVGIGSVFSREFYDLVKSRLKDDGVVCQWFQVYEMHDDIVLLVLRTFASVFPYVEIWDANEGDILLVGSRQPFPSGAKNFQHIFDREGPRKDLESIGIHSPAALLGRQWASQRTAYAVPGNGRIQTDGFPVLEYEAPKAFFLGQGANRIFQFDERTWQKDLAPQEKRSLLSSLDETTLREVFTRFGPANSDLSMYLHERFRTGKPDTILEFDGTALPTIFQPATVPAPEIKIPADASANLRLLLEGASLLDTPKASEGIQKIEAALHGDFPPNQAGTVSQYVSQSIRTSLRLRQIESARKLLSLGLKINPTSENLQYLCRIMVHEKLISPDDLVGVN